MKQLKHYTIISILFVLITGVLAHFLYQWSGNNRIVSYFTPINESIWEHMKLLFFPMLLYAVFIILKFREDYPCIATSLYFGIIAGTLLIPVFYYAYTYLLGKDFFVLDIVTFILRLLRIFVCVLFLCFIIFTDYPPNLEIFKDPTIVPPLGYNTCSVI